MKKNTLKKQKTFNQLFNSFVRDLTSVAKFPLSKSEVKHRLLELLLRQFTCKSCLGKGYATEFKGDTLCLADFIGEKTYRTRQCGFRVNLCTCDRGQNLKKYFNIKKEFKLYV